MRIVYMGTPEIAREVLEGIERLADRLPVEIAAVFTQPDKPVGRKKILTAPPVKEWAIENQVPFYQPKSIKSKESVRQLRELAPDLIVVTAYGQILPPSILKIPPFGCVNMHASLLPRLRGSSPIQHAILEGYEITGVTAMLMDEGMDTGDILLQKEAPLSEEETTPSLTKKLGAAGTEIIASLIEMLIRGKTPERIPQKNEEATYAPMIQKEDGLISFGESAAQIERKIRAYDPWPEVFAEREQKGEKVRVSLLRARCLSEDEVKTAFALDPEAVRQLSAGETVKEAAWQKHPRLIVKTGKEYLEILELRVPGKKALSAEEFLRGRSF